MKTHLSDKDISIETRAENVVERAYEMLSEEIHSPLYTREEIDLLKDEVYYYGRFLNPKTRKYAVCTMLRNISKAISYFGLENRNEVSVIDLGCGLGMQSIIFASFGAKVLGIDKQERCISLCQKRKGYYQDLWRKDLDIDFLQSDFSKFDPHGLKNKYDGLFSMSAFVYIQPLHETVSRISSILKERSRLFIYDKNPEYLFMNSLKKSSAALPSPRDVGREFQGHGFSIDFITGGCSIPRYFWTIDPFIGIVSVLNDLMKSTLRFSFNYLLGAHREKRRA